MIQELSSGATREALTLSQINSISIPVCSFTEQELIVAELESKYTVLKNVEETTVKKLAQIEVLKQTILYKAFAGELVFQNPDDEPAYKLLDKIKLERLEFLQNKPKENKISIKIKKMERTKSVLDLLKEAKEPIPAKEVWQQSKHWENIDNFYAELKSISELIEQTKSKTEILLSLKK
jgi:type I restriction enzyme S subunit